MRFVSAVLLMLSLACFSFAQEVARTPENIDLLDQDGFKPNQIFLHMWQMEWNMKVATYHWEGEKIVCSTYYFYAAKTKNKRIEFIKEFDGNRALCDWDATVKGRVTIKEGEWVTVQVFKTDPKAKSKKLYYVSDQDIVLWGYRRQSNLTITKFVGDEIANEAISNAYSPSVILWFMGKPRVAVVVKK